MLEFLKNEANKTYTENMAVTHLSTLSDCLDLFATVGALRSAADDEIASRFMRAYTENPNIAMKLAFFAGDAKRAGCHAGFRQHAPCVFNVGERNSFTLRFHDGSAELRTLREYRGVAQRRQGYD